jgi:hypothetical protein
MGAGAAAWMVRIFRKSAALLTPESRSRHHWFH